MQQVQDFALISPLLDLKCVTFLLHFHDLLALNINHMLAAFKRCLKLTLLFHALAELPLCFVHYILLYSDSVKLSIELTSVCVESICARTVIRKDLCLVDGLVLGALLLDRMHLLGPLGVLHSNFLAS